MENIEFELETEYIELIKLLKVLQIAESGGQAKLFVDNGEVLLNEEPEQRKRAKLRKGDVVEIFNVQIKIV
ncbi:MAG: RNA-binding S4 domain-containing protein [Prolixibacteraceae bacterium]|jgi:ribosome-associated protein|nr:RNA-binding S4 domain-containing protein [Prolixibacteraceae bacterium]